MKVKSGASASDGRYLEVELEESDLNLPSEIGAMEKHKKMMQEADLLIVKYMLDAGLFTKDYALSRLKEIKSR